MSFYILYRINNLNLFSEQQDKKQTQNTNDLTGPVPIIQYNEIEVVEIQPIPDNYSINETGEVEKQITGKN